MTWTVRTLLQFFLTEGIRQTMSAVPQGFSLELGSVANGMEQLLQETGKGGWGQPGTEKLSAKGIILQPDDRIRS